MLIEVDAILADLPADPRVALLDIVERLEKYHMHDKDRATNLYIAVNIIDSWCKSNTISVTMGEGNIAQQYTAALEQVTKVRIAVKKERLELLRGEINEKVIMARDGSLHGFGYAKLDPTEKEEIHGSLSKIRTIIEQSNLPDRKKNALFKKLNNLREEVDRTGTKTDAFFGILGDLGVHIGQFGEDTKPLTQEVKSVLQIIMRSRARAENVALPRDMEFPLIENTHDT